MYNQLKYYVDTLKLPNPCGPTEFAKAFIDASDVVIAHHTPGWPFCKLGNDKIEELIGIAFAATTCPDEGRYSRFQLFANSQKDELHTIMQFSSPLKVSVDTIRKLAPALPSSEYALRVESCEGQLLCDSVLHFPLSGSGLPGHPALWIGDGGQPGLLIRGERPGELRVSQGLLALRLHSGSVEEVTEFSIVPTISKWLQETARCLVGKTAIRKTEASLRFGGQTGMMHLVTGVWSHVLAQVVDARHGGSFAILRPPTANYVSFKYKSPVLDLGCAISNFLLNSIIASESNDREQLRLWMVSRDRLLATMNLVASLANVDGCVVLSPDLVVQGFGGEISVDENSLGESTAAPFFDATHDDVPVENQDASQFGGTRHRSAYRLAKVSPNAIVFVISQDGDLRAFCNDEGKKVYAFHRLDAGLSTPDLQRMG
jgi:hypothetical protein